MTYDPYQAPVPEWLEDEVWLVETGGEMPQVALAESLHHLGGLPEGEKDLLKAAAVRGYLNIIERDLQPEHLGQPHFRGLERAGQNLERLIAFLGRLGWPPPADRWSGLAPRLAAYLRAEERALDAGRDYASATPAQVRRVAGPLGLDLKPFSRLLERLAALPALDFQAIRALERLRRPAGAVAKRRGEVLGKARLEVLGPQGRPLEGTELNLLGADDREDPQCRARVEQVWEMLNLPEE